MEELGIKDTQRISLEILHTIADICEKEGLRYYLIYGTLIGAIRHKGYIPWDDDVDIMMPRPDYEKFLDYMKKNSESYENLRVFNHRECKEYPYMITRVSDDRYTIDMDNEKPYGMGVFVDVYPYDGLGDTKEEALKFGLKGDRLSSLCYQSTRCHYAVETTKGIIKRIAKLPVYWAARIIGKDYFQNKLEKLEGKKEYDSSRYVGCVVWLSGGIKDIFPKKWFDEYIMVTFDKYQFRAPKYYDKMLRHIYGDYMELPPEKERVGHHYYRVYKKN